MKKVTRLYDQFHPENYQIDLTPNKENLVFSGSIIIKGHKSGRPSKRITFHQNGLKVVKATIVHHHKDNDKTLEIDRINLQKKYDELRLHTKETVFPGKYTITIEFSGKITKNMEGIYPCFFKHNEQDKKLIATQFESHFARQVFPCIDEPEAKATFDLSLNLPKGETVISNTPVKTQLNSGKLVTTTFENTPIMSTYLVAFVFGELKYLEAKTKRGVVVRTYATPDNVAFTKFALEVGVKCLDFYSDYFDIDYPLAKCDMIALPDFASGAMENWGCITYREQTLLVDPKNTSLSMKQYVAMVVAHELTHQWFGNLVTMKWWTDLWLNEGFASWFEYLALNELFPEWDMWTQFIVDDQLQGLKADALEHTHPIELEVNHPDEIRSIFDNISYHKGASVIHMLHSYLGADDFQTGLRYYLKKYSFKNTVTNDLWDAFETASEKPVRKFMHKWTSQSGHPILTVDADDQKLTISQQRFVLNPKSKHQVDHIWPVPLLQNNDKLPELLENKILKLSIKSENLKLNQNGAGFYRTVYNESHLQLLAHKIKTGHLEPLDRLNILSDSIDAAKAGFSSITSTLELLESYSNESNNAVWDIIAGLIGSIRLIMGDDEVRELMKPYVGQLTYKEYKRLGWKPVKDEPYFDSLLRPMILSMTSSADNQEVVDKCLKMFNEIKISSDGKTTNKINPDFRSVVYGTIARQNKKSDYLKLVEMHESTESNEEKLNICSALTSYKDPELIKKSLDYIKTQSVRLQDTSYWLAYSFANRHAHKITWKWMKDNWKWLEDNLGGDLAFHRMPVYASRGVNNIDILDDYKKFFNNVMSPAIERSFKQGVEIIEWQSAWYDRDYQQVKVYFKNNTFG